MRFELAPLGGVFEGTLVGDKLIGKWTQGGKTLPLTFQPDTTTAVEKDYGQGDDHQIHGHWLGTLLVQKTQLRLAFHIALLPDGSYTASLDSLDQGSMNFPATTVQVNYPDIRMEWKLIGAVFAGTLKSGKLSGNWRQGPTSLPLEMKRDVASANPPR